MTQELRELAFMQLARTHYGARQNRYAIYYFDKVERGNTQWLEALFESQLGQLPHRPVRAGAGQPDHARRRRSSATSTSPRR